MEGYCFEPYFPKSLPCEQRPFDLPRYLSRKIEGPLLAGYQILGFLKVLRFSLNFIRLLRVARGENDSKQSDEFQATFASHFRFR